MELQDVLVVGFGIAGAFFVYKIVTNKGGIIGGISAGIGGLEDGINQAVSGW